MKRLRVISPSPLLFTLYLLLEFSLFVLLNKCASWSPGTSLWSNPVDTYLTSTTDTDHHCPSCVVSDHSLGIVDVVYMPSISSFGIDILILPADGSTGGQQCSADFSLRMIFGQRECPLPRLCPSLEAVQIQ